MTLPIKNDDAIKDKQNNIQAENSITENSTELTTGDVVKKTI